MIERSQHSNGSEEFRSREQNEEVEQRFNDLLEFVAHSANRPSTTERMHDALESFSDVLQNLLNELHVKDVEHVIEHIKERLIRGQHDLVADYLRNMSKLQHAEYAQEFLKLQGVPLPVPADDQQEEVVKIGRTAIISFTESID